MPPEINWQRLESNLHKRLCQNAGSRVLRRHKDDGKEPICARAIRLLRVEFDREVNRPTQ